MAELDLYFDDRKVNPSFGRRINSFLTNFHCPFSQHERFKLGSWPFWKVSFFDFKYSCSDFYRWDCKPLLGLPTKKCRRTNCRKSHRNWLFRSWEIWIYSSVMRFFNTFSNLMVGHEDSTKIVLSCQNMRENICGPLLHCKEKTGPCTNSIFASQMYFVTFLIILNLTPPKTVCRIFRECHDHLYWNRLNCPFHPCILGDVTQFARSIRTRSAEFIKNVFLYHHDLPFTIFKRTFCSCYLTCNKLLTSLRHAFLLDSIYFFEKIITPTDCLNDVLQPRIVALGFKCARTKDCALIFNSIMLQNPPTAKDEVCYLFFKHKVEMNFSRKYFLFFIKKRNHK